MKKLNANPALREQIGGLLLSVEDEMGELETADDAEENLIERMRQMGWTSLEAWAQQRHDAQAEALSQPSGVWRAGKNNSSGIPPSEK